MVLAPGLGASKLAGIPLGCRVVAQTLLSFIAYSLNGPSCGPRLFTAPLQPVVSEHSEQ